MIKSAEEGSILITYGKVGKDISPLTILNLLFVTYAVCCFKMYNDSHPQSPELTIILAIVAWTYPLVLLGAIYLSQRKVLSVKPTDVVCLIDYQLKTVTDYVIVDVDKNEQLVTLYRQDRGTYEEITYGRLIRKYRKYPGKKRKVA
ncbi:hypothetical protein [Bdellovibrio sp. BCCA]|uniref:hypothetical protein n=1 Tax=Bdellovibrio sp. BCCA TaxID=3136281 RepID=UPI0030F12339